MTHEISREELEAMIRDRSRFVLVEALPPQHYAAGHLPGAINLPLDGFADRAPRSLPDRDAEIVVYCSGPTCQNSHTARRFLESMGYSRVRVFSAGKSGWSEAGNRLEAGASAA